MNFDLDKLARLKAEGWLKMARHPDADLMIFNYTQRCQYEKHWTPETLACRGLILDGAGGVVARPFGKFFNYGDPAGPPLPVGEPYTVTEKIDGSLGIAYELDGETFIASRGSFDSEQAVEGTRMLRDHDLLIEGHRTPLFEIIYPENRIVVDYGTRRALVMLGAIDKKTGLDAPVPFWTGGVIEHYGELPVDDLAALAAPNSEGFVVSFKSGVRVKVKFDEYVRLHRVVTGINARSVWDAMRQGDDLDALIEGIPDEIFQWVQTTRAQIQDHFDEVRQESEIAFHARPKGMDRAETAAWFKGAAEAPAHVRGPNLAVLFSLLDRKPYLDLLWKLVKPEATTP